MSQLNKTSFANLYGSSGTTFPDNTTGEISEGDVRQFGEDIKDSFLSIYDNFKDEDGMSSNSDTAAPSQQSVKTLVEQAQSIYTTFTDSRVYRFRWVTATGTSGNQDITAANVCPADSVVTIKITTQGVATDGSEGYSSVKVASFRRDGSATPVQVGSTTSLHEVDDSSNSPSVTISMNSTNIRVAYSSGGATGYKWAIFADVSVTKV